MKRAAIQIAVLAGILLAVCAVCRLAIGGVYTASVPVWNMDMRPEAVRISMEKPDIAAPGDPAARDGYLLIPLRPEGPGVTYMDLEDGEGNEFSMVKIHVSRFGTIYVANSGGFTGDTVALAAVAVFWLVVAAIMFRVYRQARGTAFFAYSTIFAVGFSLFAMLTGILMLGVFIQHAAQPHAFSMLSAYSAISSAGWHFMFVTALPLLVFAAALAVSNIALLRHNRPRERGAGGGGGTGVLDVLPILCRLGVGMARAEHAAERLCRRLFVF